MRCRRAEEGSHNVCHDPANDMSNSAHCCLGRSDCIALSIVGPHISIGPQHRLVVLELAFETNRFVLAFDFDKGTQDLINFD